MPFLPICRYADMPICRYWWLTICRYCRYFHTRGFRINNCIFTVTYQHMQIIMYILSYMYLRMGLRTKCRLPNLQDSLAYSHNYKWECQRKPKWCPTCRPNLCSCNRAIRCQFLHVINYANFMLMYPQIALKITVSLGKLLKSWNLRHYLLGVVHNYQRFPLWTKQS